MSAITRISPREAREKVRSGQALLVCAYQSDEKFDRNHLAGAISFGELQKRAGELSKEQEIIFYCA